MSKILLVDIETAPKLAHVWGLWNQNIGIKQIVQDMYILNWSAKWLDDDYIYTDSLHYHKLWDKDPTNDSLILEDIWKMMDEADVIVGHNGDKFDIPTLNARFLYHGMQPPSPYTKYDTLKAVKRNIRMTSNKLDFLTQSFKLGAKIDTGGFELWSDIVLRKDRNAFDRMVEYCEHDVELLEELYKLIRPWDNKHPSTVLRGSLANKSCNVCQSTSLVRNGSYATITQIYQKYKCSDCGHNMRSRKAEPRTREQTDNLLRSI